MTTTCLMAWALALLLVPVLLLAWATETNRDRARRWKRQGLSQQRIADRLGCSRHRVVKLLAQPMT
jgi:DNA-binding CsgD family transcriptional regulator